jgi:hypothetical protein
LAGVELLNQAVSPLVVEPVSFPGGVGLVLQLVPSDQFESPEVSSQVPVTALALRLKAKEAAAAASINPAFVDRELVRRKP